MKLEQTIDRRYTVKKFDKEAVLSNEDLNLIKKLLQESPSSVNIQPWHFTIATTKEGKEAIAKSTANFGFNDEKIRDAAALVVFSVADVNDEHMSAVIEQEDKDGRYANEEFKIATDNGRRYFHNLNKENGIEFEWLKSQVYLNAGHFVLGTSVMGLDSVIMEGFDPKVLNEELNLGAKTPVLIVGLGKRAEDDYNAALPKSRLSQDLIIDLI